MLVVRSGASLALKNVQPLAAMSATIASCAFRFSLHLTEWN